ncbi:MAG: hypothetical protein KKD28_04380 [Chloroflexi bacterium]|nr:hypothetical protein [Chloroflexota bacterium]MBU1660690.1 hypothetical protein [Chloroflexota bacterium]
MPKTFYTERDIEDMAKRGVISLAVDDDIVLTDLARDKAMRLGIELLREQPPSAPERPYITKLTSPSASQPPSDGAAQQQISAAAQALPNKPSGDDLFQRVHKAVAARLGDSVDPKLLETIIRRVLQNVDVSTR